MQQYTVAGGTHSQMRCLPSCLLQMGCAVVGRVWGGCSPLGVWEQASHCTDPFHHPTSVILACLMPPPHSCPSGSLLSPIVLTLNIFFLPYSLIFSSHFHLCTPPPRGVPLPDGQSPAAVPARESHSLRRLPHCAVFKELLKIFPVSGKQFGMSISVTPHATGAALLLLQRGRRV